MLPPRPPHARAAVAFALAAGLSLAAFSALADRPATDRSVASQILNQQAAAPSASAMTRPLSEARRALERADSALAAGDATNARHLEGLAREWAELAIDVGRAADAEKDAGAAQQSAADTAQKVQRARAMLDELAARKARAQGEWNEWNARADAGAAPQPSARPAPPAGKPKGARR